MRLRRIILTLENLWNCGDKVRKRNDYYISDLRCMICGTVMPMPRKKGEKRERNHIKDIWCYKCKTTTKFKENETDERDRNNDICRERISDRG